MDETTRTRTKCAGHIKAHLVKWGLGWNYILLVENRNQWRNFVNPATNLRFQ
jgi:hypothetical protein